MKFNFKKAFTLAEILLVVAVISAVSLLAVSNSTKHNDENERLMQLRKTYNTIDAAYQAALSENSTPTAANIISFLKTTSTDKTKCWKNQKLTGTAQIGELNLYTDTNYSSALLSTGASIAIRIYTPTGSWGYSSSSARGVVIVDVNGAKKGSSTWADDTFLFVIYNDGTIFPAGDSNTCSTNKDLCTNKFMNTGKL